MTSDSFTTLPKFILIIIVLLFLGFSVNSWRLKYNQENIYTGYFSYIADAALFIDCKDNKRYPVAQEGDYLKIENEYLRIIKVGGEKILITFNGEIIEKNKTEGTGKLKFIVVKDIISISDKNCDNK